MSIETIRIGPEAQGLHMTLAEFEQSEVREGWLYELGRGVVIVSDVPGKRHLHQVREIKRQLHDYDADHRGVIDTIATGSECKLLIDPFESERHPDLAVYLDAMPDGPDCWSQWVPAIVIEVVSESSVDRDYDEKPEEYLQFGVREYWIVDADRQAVLIHIRSRGRWRKRTVSTAETYSTTLLPGFTLVCSDVFPVGSE